MSVSHAGSDVRKALEAQEVHTDAQESTSAIRNERKGDYMSKQFENKETSTTKASANKNKNQFAIIAGLGFFGIPLLFIAVAILSGYLQVCFDYAFCLAHLKTCVHCDSMCDAVCPLIQQLACPFYCDMLQFECCNLAESCWYV